MIFFWLQGSFREDNFQQAMTKLGASSGGRGRKGGQKGSSCFLVVKMIMERQLQPVIVFSFSRRDCEAYALQMSKLDFNTRKFSLLSQSVRADFPWITMSKIDMQSVPNAKADVTPQRVSSRTGLYLEKSRGGRGGAKL